MHVFLINVISYSANVCHKCTKTTMIISNAQVFLLYFYPITFSEDGQSPIK